MTLPWTSPPGAACATAEAAAPTPPFVTFAAFSAAAGETRQGPPGSGSGAGSPGGPPPTPPAEPTGFTHLSALAEPCTVPNRRPGPRACRIHTSAFARFALHVPHGRPGPRAGAQPRFSRQPRRFTLFLHRSQPRFSGHRFTLFLHRLRRRRITPPLFRFAAFRAASRAMDGPRIGVRGDERGRGGDEGGNGPPDKADRRTGYKPIRDVCIR